MKIHYYFCVTSNRLEAGYDMYTTEASVWYTVAETEIKWHWNGVGGFLLQGKRASMAKAKALH